MTFAPVQYALKCGAYPEKPKGSWLSHGYQMIGMYKSDWDRIGGESKTDYKRLHDCLLSLAITGKPAFFIQYIYIYTEFDWSSLPMSIKVNTIY